MLAQNESQGPPGELAFPGASYDSNQNAWYSYPDGPVRVGERMKLTSVGTWGEGQGCAKAWLLSPLA